MTDLARLTEAVEYAEEDIKGEAEILASLEPYPTVVAAARLVVDGQDVWWCEEHGSSVTEMDSDDPTKCDWLQAAEAQYPRMASMSSTCRMVLARLVFPKVPDKETTNET